MAPGEMFLNTGTCGFRAALMPVGRHIATATGSGSPRGDGPGLKTSLGDTLRSTMAAGCTTTISGDGRLDRSTSAPTILQRWSPGSVEAGAVGAGVSSVDHFEAPVGP